MCRSGNLIKRQVSLVWLEVDAVRTEKKATRCEIQPSADTLAVEKVIGWPLVNQLLAVEIRALCLKPSPLIRREQRHADAKKDACEHAGSDADGAMTEEEP